MKRLSAWVSMSSLVYLSACGVTDSMSRMDASTTKMSKTTEQLNATTATLNNTTSGMADTTQGMAATTSDMAITTRGLSQSTTAMLNTTRGMAKTTSGMAAVTDKMSEEIQFTYLDMRAGNTSDARRNAIAAMEKADEPGTKLAYASEYFAALEFQYWKPGVESGTDRDDLKTIAVSEFFKLIGEYIPKDRSVGPLAKEDKTQNLYALAASLHYLNLAQLSVIQKNPDQKIAPVNMLSMIEEGLSMKTQLDLGQVEEAALPLYQSEVLRHAEDALYILKIRQNYLKVIGLALSTQLENGNDYSSDPDSQALKSVTCLKHIAAKDGLCTAPIKWNPTYGFRNSAELNYIASVLEAADESQTFLKNFKVNPEDDAASTMMFKLMTVDASHITEAARLKALARISTAVNHFITP